MKGKRTLTKEQAEDIRRRWTRRETTQRALAAEFGVPPKMVNEIVHGRTYRDAVTTSPLRLTPLEIQRICDERSRGASYGVIALGYSRTPDAIARVVKAECK